MSWQGLYINELFPADISSRGWSRSSSMGLMRTVHASVMRYGVQCCVIMRDYLAIWLWIGASKFSSITITYQWELASHGFRRERHRTDRASASQSKTWWRPLKMAWGAPVASPASPRWTWSSKHRWEHWYAPWCLLWNPTEKRRNWPLIYIHLCPQLNWASTHLGIRVSWVRIRPLM